MVQKVTECAQVGLGRHVLIAEDDIKGIDGNGNAVFFVKRGGQSSRKVAMVGQ